LFSHYSKLKKIWHLTTC